MADNRQFTDHNEIGGTNVYFEDKKLAERTAVSGAASIANLKFLLANDDTEGFNTAIKAYIDEAIRSALGALVNNLDKGTAISRVLATDVDNDLGTITPANLASLLGVIQYKQIPVAGVLNEDLNGFKENQCRIYGGGVLPVNAPTSSGARFLIVNQSGYGYVLQKFVSHSGTSATEYARYWDGGSWSAWCQI